MKNSCRKSAPKASPRPPFILVNNLKYCMQYCLLKIKDILKEDYQKAWKKLTLFFLTNPSPFNGQNYQKQKGPVTSDLSLFRLGNKFRKIHLLVMYYLTKFSNVI